MAALLLLGILDRSHLLDVFGFRCTSQDDTVIWQMARDYGNGTFREWCMYGQNYNPMLEALLGAPFVHVGGDPWIVLPTVTSLLALLPFWSFALWHLRRGNTLAACIYAAMPLLLPVEWGMLTTITRGFVHGLALTALLPWTLSIRWRTPRPLAGALISSAAMVCNPNSLFLIVAFYTVIIVEHWRSARFWICTLLGSIPAALFWWYSTHFFDTHLWDLKHTIDPQELVFDAGLFFNALLHADRYFASLSPIWWPHGQVVLWALIATGIVLYRQGSRTPAWALMLAVSLMIMALGIPKVNNGCDSVFFTRSRMFLAAPILLCWAISQLRIRADRASLVIILLVGASLISFANKWTITTTVVDREMAHQEGSQVREVRLSGIFDQCTSIGTAAHASEADVVVPIRWPDEKRDPDAHFGAYVLCYACPFIVPDLPPTFGPDYDRRSWVHDEHAHQPGGQVLFIGGDPNAWKHIAASDTAVHTWGNPELLIHSLFSPALSIDTLITRLGIDDDPRR